MALEGATSGKKLSDLQIALLMLAAGFPPNPRVLAEGIGVVHAESGGDPKSKVPGNEHMGLWAESSAFGSEKERLNAAQATIAARKQWEADGKSFYAAWGRWEAEQAGQNGAATYKQHMGTANHAVRLAQHNPQMVSWNPLKISPLYRALKGEAPLPQFPGQEQLEHAGSDILKTDANAVGLGGVVDAVNGISEFFQKASMLLFTPEGWLQIGEVAGGIILIGWGTHTLIRLSTGVNPTGAVTKTAAKAAEVAAVIPK